MKYAVISVLAATLLAAATAAAAPRALTSYVDPLIGTLANPAPGTVDGGNVVPVAGLPSGMVQWGPDTRLGRRRPRAPMGYYYDSDTITGFSLTHVQGAGCSSEGEFPVMPLARADAATARFQHGDEQAAPGYYRVRLDSGVQAEFSGTLRTGFARFQFPAGQGAFLVLDATRTHSNANPTVGSLTIAGQTVSGSTIGSDFCRSSWSMPVYMAARFDQPFSSVELKPGKQRLAFAPGATVQMQVGLSYVSLENARANLEAESRGWDFGAVRRAADAAWEQRLSAIKVQSRDPVALTKFYTALYHALLAPTVFSDVNGDYIGLDHQPHRLQAGQGAQYTGFSGWDVYRSLISLRAVLDPAETSDMMQSLVNDAAHCGALPRWVLNHHETGVMAGPSGIQMVAQGYAFGARAFDAQAALAAMQRMQNLPGTAGSGHLSEAGRGSYLQYGYIVQDEWTHANAKPGQSFIYCHDKNMEHNRCNAEGEIGHASTTLEYASADFAAARFAQALGAQRQAALWDSQASNWRNLFRTGTPGLTQGLIIARNRDGSWSQPDEVRNYLEGNAEQYTWMIPHDMAGLIAQMGGRQAAVARLDRFFTNLNAGMELPNFYMGNEPGFSTPWLYNWAGAPARTQRLVQQIMRRAFGRGPDGLAGNDDLGAVSGWYVWAALGLYPSIPGLPGVSLSSPQFEAITLRLANGRRLQIHAAGAPQRNYIQGLRLNGQPVQRAWLDWQQLAQGGQLDFAMGAKPSSWASAADKAPPSFGPAGLAGNDDLAAVSLNAAADHSAVRALADGAPDGADFDGEGHAYAAPALAAAGVGPGQTLTVQGVAIPWLQGEHGLDAILVRGQLLALPEREGVQGGTLLVAGAATHGPSRGQAVLVYRDGTREAATLAFDDWTLNGGRDAVSAPWHLQLPYRVDRAGAADPVPAYVFAIRIPLRAGKQLACVQLPQQLESGRMHIFGLAVTD